MPNIAVLLAVYEKDDAAMFERAVQSIIAQKLDKKWEVNLYLGVNGPVPAAISEVICSNESFITELYASEYNMGLAPMLNVLISKLRDEQYIFRMDADDISLAHRFQTQIDFFEENPDVDILGSQIIEYDRSRQILQIVSFPRDHQECLRMAPRRVPIAHPTACIRRRVFDFVEGYPVVPGNEDVAMWFECFSAGMRFANVDRPLLIFSVNDAFWARRSFRKSLTEFTSFWRGVKKLNFPKIYFVFPVIRFFLRLIPSAVMRWAYSSRFLRG